MLVANAAMNKYKLLMGSVLRTRYSPRKLTELDLDLERLGSSRSMGNNA